MKEKERRKQEKEENNKFFPSLDFCPCSFSPPALFYFSSLPPFNSPSSQKVLFFFPPLSLELSRIYV